MLTTVLAFIAPPHVPPHGHRFAVQGWAVVSTARALIYGLLAIGLTVTIGLDLACYWVLLAAILGVPTSFRISRGLYPDAAPLTARSRAELAIAVHVPAVVATLSLTLWTATHL